MSDERIRIREGTPDDLPLVLRHRRGMFRDMGYRDEERLDAMEAVSAPFFADRFAQRDLPRLLRD